MNQKNEVKESLHSADLNSLVTNKLLAFSIRLLILLSIVLMFYEIIPFGDGIPIGEIEDYMRGNLRHMLVKAVFGLPVAIVLLLLLYKFKVKIVAKYYLIVFVTSQVKVFINFLLNETDNSFKDSTYFRHFRTEDIGEVMAVLSLVLLSKSLLGSYSESLPDSFNKFTDTVLKTKSIYIGLGMILLYAVYIYF